MPFVKRMPHILLLLSVFSLKAVGAPLSKLEGTVDGQALLKKARDAHIVMLNHSSNEKVLKAKFDAAKTDFEKSGFAIGLAQYHLRNGNSAEAGKILDEFRTQQIKVPSQLGEIFAVVAANVSESQNQVIEAIEYLRPYAGKSGLVFGKRISSAFLRNLAKAGLWNEAKEFYEQNESFFERYFDDFELEQDKLGLALSQQENPDRRFYLQLLKDVADRYPITSHARKAHGLYQEAMCKSDTFEEVWVTQTQRRSHAREVMLHVGPRADVRQFVLALGGINEDVLVPTKSTLDENFVSELLEKLEFLVNLKEYGLAEKVADHLKETLTEKNNREFDKFLFLYGRTMNSLNKPKLAAEAYKRLFERFPNSRYATTAKSRYGLSLHFSQSYKLAAKQFSKLASEPRQRRASMLWNAFWAEYLSQDNEGTQRLIRLLSKERSVDAETRVSLKYWMARTLERRGDKAGARKLLGELKANSNNNFYGLLARWRLALLEGNKPTVFKERPQSLRVWVNSFKPSDSIPQKFAFLNSLLNFGLTEFGQTESDLVSSALRDEAEAAAIAKLAYATGQFKVTSLVPRRMIWELRSIPNNEREIVSELTEHHELWRMSFPLAYGPIVEEMARELSIDPFLLFSIMRAESNYDVEAFSPVGALGLLQIMPQSGVRIAAALKLPEFEPRDLLKPDVNIAFAAWYVKRLLAHYGGNIVLAVAAYNAGPEAVDRWLKQTPHMHLDEFVENIPYKETKTYVGRVLLNYDMYHRIYTENRGGLDLRVAASLPTPFHDPDLF